MWFGLSVPRAQIPKEKDLSAGDTAEVFTVESEIKTAGTAFPPVLGKTLSLLCRFSAMPPNGPEAGISQET